LSGYLCRDRHSNPPFDKWTWIFGSEGITGALLNRITHHVHCLEMNAGGYRPGKARSRGFEAIGNSNSALSCFEVAQAFASISRLAVNSLCVLTWKLIELEVECDYRCPKVRQLD
jgi:hypothetical protein